MKDRLMIDTNSPEIYWLALTVLMTALLWIPQILHSVFRAGPNKAFLYPDEAAKEYADWAIRSKAAHNNAVENLVIFAPLALAVNGKLFAPVIAFSCAAICAAEVVGLEELLPVKAIV